MLWKYVLLWFGLAVLSVINGSLRNGLYGKVLSDLRSQQISTIFLLILIGVYTWFVSGLWPLESAGRVLLVGLIWVLMTIMFEFIFGHYAVKKTWRILLRDYNLLKGRIWILVPG